MLRQIFTEIKCRRRVTGKAISDLTGISQSHISDFLTGKRDVTSETLWRMIEAIEELSPGAKSDFMCQIAGKEEFPRIAKKEYPRIAYEELDEDRLADELLRLGKAWKSLRSQSSKSHNVSSLVEA